MESQARVLLRPLRRRVIVAIALVSELAWCSRAIALNSALDVNQYSHTAWKIRDGFSKGAVRSIAQTPDGYLWLATEFGLLRFDGVRAVPWQHPPDQSLPSEDIWSVLASRDGALWVGTAKGLARWKDGAVTLYPEIGDRLIGRLLEDHADTVWVSASSVPAGQLCAVRGREVKCYGEDGSFGYGIWTLWEDRRRSLWLATNDGVWRWNPGRPTFFAMPGEGDRIQAFAEDRDGALLLTTRRGIRRFTNGRADSYPHSGPQQPVVARRLLRDRDGALWIATPGGVVHAREGRTDTFSFADGLSGYSVTDLFEDREGNVWVATENGLDRFRDVVVAAVSEKQGLANPQVRTVHAGVNGNLWLATTDSLEEWKNGHFTSYRGRLRRPATNSGRQIVVRGLPDSGIGAVLPDNRGRIWIASATAFGYVERNNFVTTPTVAARAVRSIARDSDGYLWLADQYYGLLRVSPRGSVAQTHWTALGRKDFATAMIVNPEHSGLWLGFWDGGIGHYENGRMRETYSAADGLGNGRVANLRFASDGSLWAATQGGLSRLRDGIVTTLTRRNGLPCDAVHWTVHDDSGSLWLDTACGLVRVAREDVNAWTADERHVIRPILFDGSDGARVQAMPTGFAPYVAKSSDGRLWFVGPNGLQVADPRRLNTNTLPPPVHIEQIIADRQTYVVSAKTGGSIRLPPLVRDLQIDYTALSLVAPEKMRFRYKLEGFDDDWQEAGSRRQAFYTNLPPREYRFRVAASNNSGVWNEAGAFVDFSVAPAYYQTSWFVTLAVTAFAVLLWGAHRVRLRVVEKHEREITALNERLMKAQEQERIRIAGELHDGVMQEMLAVTMMLGTAKRRIPEGSDAKATIDKIQEKMIRVGTDLRRVSHDLHPPALQKAGLPPALQTYCDEFAASSGIPVTCEVDERVGDLSRGAALALFRIAQEALGNAAKHASARHITIRLKRSEDRVSLEVSDDGRGFDWTRLGNSGGLGLITMRERAGQLNGTFDVESAPGQGATIRVTIPFR